MATCKDCLHVEACTSFAKMLFDAFDVSEDDTQELLEKCKGDASVCNNFADRSMFVELSCAEWIEDEDMYGDPIYRCSNCDEHFILEEGTPTDNGYFYCPNCGAKMGEQALKERE